VTHALTVAEKSHSELGASVASRWMACPGSVQLSRGRPNPSSIYAQEGTAAHALGELSLRKGVDPATFIGTTLEGVEVTEEMADYVRVYFEHCQTLIAEIEAVDDMWVEKQFNLGALNPPGPMFGTADFVALDVARRLLDVVDLKYGQGVVVEVKGNEQLRYYALGAVLSLAPGDRALVDRVRITIVQPRAMHPDGVIRSETISLADLLDYSVELMDAAKATQEPDAPLVPGDHCRFCPASGDCPAQARMAQEIAQTEFADMPLSVPPDPAQLPPEILADIMGKLPILEDWSKAVRESVMRRLKAGEDVPGFKLVRTRSNRRWVNESETEQWLKAQGREPDEIATLKLKSPAQIEKLIGKKNLPADLHFKPEGGYAMAPAHDPRPAITLTSGEEFLALPSGDEE
jgi:hypothetical protein